MIQPILIAALLAGAPQSDRTFDEEEAAWSVVNISFGSAAALTGGLTLGSLAMGWAFGGAAFVWSRGTTQLSEEETVSLVGAAAASAPGALLGTALLGGGVTLIYLGRAALVEQLSRLEPKRALPKPPKRRRRPGRRLD